MLIVCPTCGTTYNVGAETLGQGGRQVRCVRCRSVWRAERPHPLVQTESAATHLPSPPPEKPKPGAIFDPEMALAAARSRVEITTAGADDTASALHVAAPDSTDARETGLDAPLPERAGHEREGHEREEHEETHSGETIEAPPLAPSERSDWQHAIPPGEGDSRDTVESFAERRARLKALRKRAIWPLGLMQTALIVLIVIDGALILWRGHIVRAFPQAAAIYAALGLPVNLRGLTFENVATTQDMHEGVPVLVVEGGIVNPTTKPVEVPRLRFAVRNASGHEIYSWTAMPARTVLSGREAFVFRTRLASPPPDAKDVSVRFFSRSDATAGAR